MHGQNHFKKVYVHVVNDMRAEKHVGFQIKCLLFYFTKKLTFHLIVAEILIS